MTLRGPALGRLAILAWLPLVGCAQPVPDQADARRPTVATVTVPGAEGQPLRALLALPTSGAAGRPIVALHGCDGLAPPERALRLPEREADWAARLTEAGHPVLFPDSFGSRGLGSACGVRGFPAPAETVRAADARAAATWAAAQPWASPGGVVLLGWSNGGTTALAAVAQPLPHRSVRAAIAYYPGCGGLRRAAPWQPAVPALLLLGAADDWTPAAECQALAAGTAAEVETYAGAQHGFDHPGRRVRTLTLPNGRMVTTGTDPAARAASLARVDAFLRAQDPP